MKKIFFYIFCLSILLFSDACQKDKEEFIPTGTTVIQTTAKADTIWENESDLQAPVVGVPTQLLNIEKLINELNKPIIKDSISAEQGGKIELPDDVSLEFPSSPCVSKSNQALKGKLEIEIQILRTRGELIAHDKPTISGGKLLISGGVVFLSAKQNGVEVKVGQNKTIKIRYKIRNTEGSMLLFEGKNLNRLQFDWTLVSTSRDVVTTWADSSQEKKGFQLLLDRFGWINCDRFNDEPNLTNKFCVAMPDSFTNRNTSVYIAFKDILSVVKLEGAPVTKQFCIPQSYKGIPIGKQVTVISISNINGHSYMDVQDATITASNNIRLQPKAFSLDDIKKKISNL